MQFRLSVPSSLISQINSLLFLLLGVQLYSSAVWLQLYTRAVVCPTISLCCCVSNYTLVLLCVQLYPCIVVCPTIPSCFCMSNYILVLLDSLLYPCTCSSLFSSSGYIVILVSSFRSLQGVRD